MDEQKEGDPRYMPEVRTFTLDELLEVLPRRADKLGWDDIGESKVRVQIGDKIANLSMISFSGYGEHGETILSDKTGFDVELMTDLDEVE
jgi:hypothetical protein